MENKGLNIKIILDGLNQLLNGNYKVCVDVSPQSELGEIGEKINKLSDELQSCSSAIEEVSRGGLSSDIKGSRGLSAALKTVQANFRHLAWQIQRVADGDLSQKILPLGGLSAAFNKMVISLDEAKKELAAANAELEKRVEERTADLKSANVLLKLEIAERKQAEEKVAQSEEKHRTLFEDSLEAMSLTIDKKIVDVNHAWLRLHGFEDKNEVIGMNIIDVIHPEDQKTLVERRRMWPEKSERVYQLRDVRKDGSVVFVEVFSSGIYLDGKDAILATVRDITMLKRAEEEKSALEEKVRRSEKMEAIGLLAGGVAHDLNNVLSGIVTYPELLLLDISEESPLRKPILTIQESGKKAAAIVQDLLTLARRGVTTTEVVNLNDIINEYLKSPEHQKLKSYHPNVQVETNLEADVLYILGSPVHLSKTVMNLVYNAADAMPNGGKILTSTESRYIDRPVRGYDNVDEGEYVSLSVSDTGVGISPEDIQKIFEPFYTKKEMGRSGTGLGMAIVWGTVKDHKGYIDVQSTEGKGTTFILYFPITRQEPAKEETCLSIEDYMGKGESILVVDDVKEQREIALTILSKLGYSVTTISNGEQAVEYMKNKKVHLLILDMIMDPGIDGLDTYRQILELHPRQKAIIASGFSQTARVKEAQRLGAGLYIKKPYTLEKLGTAVRNELDKE